MIRGFDRDRFVEVLHTYLSPTAPVQSQEHLFGRNRQLQMIQQALCAPGRSIFIYGDRGVGKTSLAQTVAYSHQASIHDPVLLACTPETTFGSLVAEVLFALEGEPTQRTSVSHSAKFGFKGASIEVDRKREREGKTTEQFSGELNALVHRLLKIAAARKDQDTVVVVDEFDRITNDQERSRFADFIKQIGDQGIPIRFVFCGVSGSMQALLGAHDSCYRYLEGIELATLNWDARFEIIDSAAGALAIRVEDRPRFRIAAISDGFPHYIHRICEHLFWQMFNDPLEYSVPSLDHYREAVSQSVLGIEQHLRGAYERAVLKEAHGYEEVLWAMADHADLARNTEAIFDSYQSLFENSGKPFLDRQTVVARLNVLKAKPCGHILTSNRRGWYQFKENIIRGYVRLRAEDNGVELALDYSATSTSTPSLRWGPRSSRKPPINTRHRDWDYEDVKR